MTVDELLAKLDAEYDKLESALPEHYQRLGVSAFSYPEQEHHSYRYEISSRRDRQSEIRKIQATLKREVGRITA